MHIFSITIGLNELSVDLQTEKIQSYSVIFSLFK